MPRIRPLIWEICHSLVCRLYRPLRLALRVRQDGGRPEGATLVLAKHASSWDIPLLATLCRRQLGKRPYFQMGSFVGYRVLGTLVPLLKVLGGFPVMRPKEVRRLQQREGLERRAALERMREVNAEAEAGRRALLEAEEALVVFPEATRSAEAVAPLRSELELTSALEVTRAGRCVMIWPVVLSFGAARGLRRRRARVRTLEPFVLDAGTTPKAVLERIEALFRAHWESPASVDAGPSPSAG